MEFSQYPMPLRDAIVEIAETNAELHLATSITAGDCEEQAKDVDVQVAFWAMQMAVGDVAESWSDILDKLTDSERNVVLCSLAVQHPSAITVLRDAVVAHICEWLAYQAEKYQEDHPAEEPPTRPGYYAELARAAAAAHRTNREQYLDV